MVANVRLLKVVAVSCLGVGALYLFPAAASRTAPAAPHTVAAVAAPAADSAAPLDMGWQ